MDDQMTYVKVHTLSSEYNTKESNATTLVGSNKGATPADQKAAQEKSRQDSIGTFESEATNPVAEDKVETPFSKYGLEGITEGDANTTKRVLDNIALLSTDPVHQNLAKAYADLGIEVSTQEDATIANKDGDAVLGRADYVNGIIKLNPEHKTNSTDRGFEHTFLHELTHHLTIKGVREGGLAAENLKNVTDILKQRWKSGAMELSEDNLAQLEYIFEGKVKGVVQYKVTPTMVLQEFTAFAMSNTKFQELLKEQPYVIKGQNFWEKLVTAFSDVLSAMGVTDSNNMLAAAMNDVLTLTDQGRVTSTKESVAETETKFKKINLAPDVSEISDLPAYSDQDVVTLNTLANMGLLKTTPSTIEEAITAKKNC